MGCCSVDIEISFASWKKTSTTMWDFTLKCWTPHLKTAKKVNFMLCVSYHNFFFLKKEKNKWIYQEESRRLSLAHQLYGMKRLKPKYLRIYLRLHLREGFYTFTSKEVPSIARLSSSVAGHTERFIVGGCLVFLFLSRENFGCNCQLQSRHLSPPTAHRPRECLELASRQGWARTGSDGVRSHF